jgi:hypothetical protein
MSRATMRGVMAGALALAVVGVVGGALPTMATSAEAASSPFVGTYAWDGWTISISTGGKVNGSYSYRYDGGTGETHFYGKMSGTISNTGNLVVTITETQTTRSQLFGNTKLSFPPYQETAVVVLDGSGNIVGTASDWGEFIWYRQ